MTIGREEKSTTDKIDNAFLKYEFDLRLFINFKVLRLR